jgi:serine/threonine protein kinase
VGTVVGSPSYIAPEVWRGRPELLDHRVDAYSLAVIMFRMLSGALPFESKEIVEVLKMATTGKRPSLHGLRPDLPPRVDLWVEQALAIDPNRRYSSAGQCLEQLYISAGAGRVLASVREAIQKPPSEQQASAAERIASVLHNAAAALKFWTMGKDKDKDKVKVKVKKEEPKDAPPAAKPRTRTVPPVAKSAAKQRGKTLPKMPKVTAPARPAKAGRAPPPPPAAKGRKLSPPSRTKPGRTQSSRSMSKVTMRAISPGKLPPPPKPPSKRSKQ